MTLKDQLNEDLKTAMRSGDETRKSVIRLLRSAILNAEKSGTREPIVLDDDGVITVLSRQAKQRRDSIEAFHQGGRQDLVLKEEAELEIITEYLPKQMTEEEVRSLAINAVKDVGASGPKEMGKVMASLMPKIKGRVDGKIVREIVTDLLESL
ncbi:MAG: GatB/YqeY domain-containing protein [SAR202 cluster bacterium]|nr:GatB/YqeY domain-containing protein [SAR202 cluster bacterium]